MQQLQRGSLSYYITFLPCLPSSQAVAAVVRKNWLPLVWGPLFAIESTYLKEKGEKEAR
jgi:hypothetical protein